MSQIEKVKSIDWKKIIVQGIGDQKFEDFLLGEMPASEFLVRLEECMRNLEEALADPFIRNTLHVQVNIPNTFNGSVSKLLDDLLAVESSKNPGAMVAPVMYLTIYQMLHGVWPKAVRSPENISNDELKEKQEKLKLLDERYSERVVKIEELKDAFETFKTDMSNFVAGRQGEINAITQALGKVREESDQVTQTKASIEKAKGEIDGVKTAVDSVKDTLQKNLTDLDNKWNEIESVATSYSEQLSKDLDAAETKLNKAKEAIEFIESKREDIIGLVGQAADGSLGHTYKKRSEDLKKDVDMWRKILGATVLIVIAWVVVVFKCLNFTGFEEPWINLGINLLKTTPAFIGLGFVFRQYGKERNIEEEYAFRAAVALTVNAYADILANEKANANGEKSSRAEMLLRAINQVHTPPRLYNDRPDRIFTFNTKHLSDSIANLNEAIKNLKS